MEIDVPVSVTMHLNEAKAPCPVSGRGSSTAFVIRRDQLARPTTYSGTATLRGPLDNSLDLENELRGAMGYRAAGALKTKLLPRVRLLPKWFRDAVTLIVVDPAWGPGPSAEPG